MLFSDMKYPGILYSILFLDLGSGVEIGDALLGFW